MPVPDTTTPLPDVDRGNPLTTQKPSPHLSRIGALAAGALMGFVIFSVFTHVAHAGFWNRVAALVSGRSTRIDTSSPSVVDKIRELSRLETVNYSIDKIVEGDRQNPYLPDFLVGDKILLVAHGEVIAGVDLGQLKPNDVTVHGDSVDVRLPPAQVLTTRIDNSRTRVYSRTTGLLVPADPTLESQVRQAAEQQFTQAAMADGVLQRARTNARNSVSALLHGLGFQHINVE
jgi:hypothetical protein